MRSTMVFLSAFELYSRWVPLQEEELKCYDFRASELRGYLQFF